MTPESLMTFSDAHCPNVTTGVMSTMLLFEEGASEGEVRAVKGEGAAQKG